MRILAPLVVLAFLASAAQAKLPPPPEQAAIVETGKAPCGLDAHDGELWVGVYEAGQVLRLDRGGRVQRRHRVGRYACQVAVNDGAAWVTRDNANELVRIDRRTGRMTRVRISSPFGVTLAAGSVWVTSFETGTVTRLDPATGRTKRVFRVGGKPTGITACAGRIWVGHGRDATWLTAIDPSPGRTRRVDVVVRTPRWPRCIDGQLWVTTEDSALRIAPRSGALLGRFALGSTLAEAGFAESSGGVRTIWVTNKERSLVHRIDPASRQVVDTFPAGPGALAQAQFAGSVWITSFAGSDVRRYDP